MPHHSSDDLRNGPLAWSALLFAGMILLGLGIAWALIRHTMSMDHASAAFANIQPGPADQPLQPSPGHPYTPAEDLARLRDSQLQWLDSSGPLPGDPGHMHIPIDQAMRLLLRRGISGATPPGTQPYLLDAPAQGVKNRT